jgi:hypothetical protein
LRDLFISRRELKKKGGKMKLREVLRDQERRISLGSTTRLFSDEEIRLRLKSEFGLNVSRRSINNWKRELGKEKKVGD